MFCNASCLLILLLSSSMGKAYKILAMFPIPSKSHAILGDGIVHHLLNAGHEVTYVTPFTWKTPPSNLHKIDVSENDVLTSLADVMIQSTIQSLLDKTAEDNDFFSVSHMNEAVTNMTYANEDLQKILNDPNQQFDLVIIEWMATEVSVGLSAVFNCPYVWAPTMEPQWLLTRLVDEPQNPAYHSDNMSNYIPPFTFWQRLVGLWKMIKGMVVKEFILQERQMYESIFGPLMAKRGRPLPPFDDIKYNASLVLGNSHFTTGDATRLPQIYKPIGGYHINPEVKPLPEDLQKLMNNATNGVIYFSMGSNVKSKLLPENIKKGLLNIFGGLKQTVLWKFEEELPDLPVNVHILPWAPQYSVLAHPNCVLFITHGGILSTLETVHFGVPIVGIPVFGDQIVNVLRAERKGIGRKVDISHSLVEDLNAAIREVVNDQSYRERVKALSLAYHDRVAPPAAELVHWVEHVVRTRGAPHLRSPALMLPWYQKLYLDLIALCVLTFYLLKLVLKRMFFSKKYSKQKQN